MTTWFKQVANNGLSYLNAQIEPLRQRQKFGKTPEEIAFEIKEELATTMSREKDVERKISQQEEDRKKIRSEHQELNFRVQNLDENRQFLFKQSTEYEQKLSDQALEQRKLLMTIDKLKSQLSDIENVKLRSISLNLRGATELKEGTLTKIPKLEQQRRELRQRLAESSKRHKEYSNVIDELSQKRDSLRKHLINAQKQHEELVQRHKARLRRREENSLPHNVLVEIKQDDESPSDSKAKGQSSSSLENMTTIFDNESQEENRSATPKADADEEELSPKEWAERIGQAESVILNLHSELEGSVEKELEAQHLVFGKLVLEKVNLEKEAQRMSDMIVLQQETLESIESSRLQYCIQQQKYLTIRVDRQSKLDELQITLDSVKELIKKYRDDIEAIKDASASLSEKKFSLAASLKKTIDKETALEEGLRILHRNRINLRSRKAQLLRQMMALHEERNAETASMRYSTQSVKCVRCDCGKTVRQKKKRNGHRDGVVGTLSCSRSEFNFVSAQYEDRKFNVKHELIDLNHSTLNNYSSTTQPPSLLILLNSDVPYHGGHGSQLRRGFVHGAKDEIGGSYHFKLQQPSDKEAMLLVHHFITLKADLMAEVERPSTVSDVDRSAEQKEAVQDEIKTAQRVSAPPRNVVSIKDIEITDELSLQITDEDELRQIIARCPARTHIWKWKLFYSTAIHGISMNTLYSNCENVEESILIIHSSTNDIFGAFVDCSWSVATDYRGSVDCFVFQFVNRSDDEIENGKASNHGGGNGDDDGSERNTDDDRKCLSRHKLMVYKASGKVPYFMRNDMESVTIGAGACSAIYFDADLNHGRSTECTTFSSPRLSQDSSFQITTLEIWAPSL